jgi:hypothetical protein
MERLKTTPAANRGRYKAHIKQSFNYTPVHVLEQCSVVLAQIPCSASRVSPKQCILDWLSRTPLTTLQAGKFLGVLLPAAGIREHRALRFTSVTGWMVLYLDQSTHRVTPYSLFVGGE